MRGSNRDKHRAMYNYVLAHVDDILSEGNDKVLYYKIEFCENNGEDSHCYEFACEEAGIHGGCIACPVGSCRDTYNDIMIATTKEELVKAIERFRDAWEA